MYVPWNACMRVSEWVVFPEPVGPVLDGIWQLEGTRVMSSPCLQKSQGERQAQGTKIRGGWGQQLGESAGRGQGTDGACTLETSVAQSVRSFTRLIYDVNLL